MWLWSKNPHKCSASGFDWLVNSFATFWLSEMNRPSKHYLGNVMQNSYISIDKGGKKRKLPRFQKERATMV